MEKNAFIEINNYTAKLIIADVQTNSFFHVVTRRVVPIELGRDFDKDRFLKRVQIDYAIDVLKQFKKCCNMYEVTKTIAIATFLHDKKPKNLNSFIDEVYTKCGFKIDYYDDASQDNALFVSSLNTIEGNKAVSCLIDYDSIRMVQYNRRGVVNHVTLPFGPLSLLTDFPKEQYEGEARFQAISDYVETELSQIEWYEEAKPLKFIGVGKLFEDLSKMVRKYKKYPFDRTHNFAMDRESIDHIYNQLLPMGIENPKKIKGIEDCRLDVFIIAQMIIQKILDRLETQTVHISKNGLLEGYILTTIIETTPDTPLLDMLTFGVEGCLMNLNEIRRVHSKHVEKLAVIIFKELKVVHKLPKSYLKVLKAAAYLHDLGYAVNYFKHSMHSLYMIINNDVLGLTHREQVLAGFVASLHHGEELSLPDWIKYQSLFEPGDAENVKKLGILLNLAESFDVSMCSVIKDIHCDILGDSVIFKTENELDKSYELTEASLVTKLFEQTFKKRPEIL